MSVFAGLLLIVPFTTFISYQVLKGGGRHSIISLTKERIEPNIRHLERVLGESCRWRLAERNCIVDKIDCFLEVFRFVGWYLLDEIQETAGNNHARGGISEASHWGIKVPVWLLT